MVTSPAEALSTPADGVEVLGSLSPSRAGDFLTCPLLYRFRTIDRLPEPTSPAAVRGTLVHKVLEQLFDLPAAERRPERAELMLGPAWAELLAADPTLEELFDDEADPVAFTKWLGESRRALATYFTLEDPTRLEPAERELYVETVLDSKLLLRGFVDRLDIAPGGQIRVVDYKTGRASGEGYEMKAFFQLKIYALALWRTRDVIPARLQLVYLGSGHVIHYDPTEADLLATERKVNAIWTAIRTAQETGNWQARKSRLCSWCSFQALCPEYGGTTPPLPGG
ncbi:RecB family exonuclease [Nocardioides sp. Kera G14]|uniref:RecB family exonuclease n=1 Tax=Nocardioides sp. Kera G14 TaxID=2884264 RepID=UPI001D120967|nr:PD-(D/E)XK nuclease family protein [Nocardioides sp. Kera G14]UDY25192.1 PD-(D/E)XK nuclease family protein [Nocardioides sp. Kera G14]